MFEDYYQSGIFFDDPYNCVGCNQVLLDQGLSCEEQELFYHSGTFTFEGYEYTQQFHKTPIKKSSTIVYVNQVVSTLETAVLIFTILVHNSTPAFQVSNKTCCLIIKI